MVREDCYFGGVSDLDGHGGLLGSDHVLLFDLGGGYRDVCTL